MDHIFARSTLIFSVFVLSELWIFLLLWIWSHQSFTVRITLFQFCEDGQWLSNCGIFRFRMVGAHAHTTAFILRARAQ